MTSIAPSPSRTGLSIPGPQKSGLTLSVLDGIHRGVTAAIQGDTCTIGAASDRDVVLADKQVAPDHLRLRFYGRQVAVDAIGGDVTVQGLPTIRKGHGRRATLPVIIELGAARIRLGRDPRQVGAMQRWLPAAAVGLVLVIGGVLLANQSSGYGATDTPSATSRATTVPAGLPVVDDAVADELRQHLADGGLSGLAVAQDGRHLTVSGTMPDSGTGAWTDAQRWFDESFGGRYVLSSRVTHVAPTGAPDFALQAVWLGAHPYIIDARGQRRYPGAALQDGWLLKSIGPEGITVSRNGTDFLLNL